jgi:quercetin dioxygenase-like cupin family protein
MNDQKSDPPTATYIADLAGEVEIPENGTLSRVVYKDDQMRLVVFGFDTGQELTDHTARHAAILHAVSGRLEVSLDGEGVEVQPGSWVHMPPNLPHAVKALEPSVMVLSLILA